MPYNVQITVKEIQGAGKCSLGIKPGDSWLIDGEWTPERFCAWALHSLLPIITVLQYGGELPWEKNKDMAVACCLDPNSPVVFELKRLPKA
ncbi:MAG: TIGR04076 family protein [Chloroflexi bacterium]|nr:TIGR04076 family protein [Chloroflexota bacterium]